MLNDYFDKIYYINLDKDTDRRANIEQAFQRFSITNYQRVSGEIINGVPSRLFYRNFIKNDARYVLGQLGCRLSHLKAIEDAASNNYNRVLIFEDDVVFLTDPNHLVELNRHMLSQHWDMLYFGGLVEPHYRNQIVCAHAYAVNRTVYDDILCMARPSGMEIDNFYAKIIQQMSYNPTKQYIVHRIEPFNQIVQNKRFESNIQQS